MWTEEFQPEIFELLQVDYGKIKALLCMLYGLECSQRNQPLCVLFGENQIKTWF